MKTYYFKSIPKAYRASYQRLYMQQNLDTVQVACMIFFGLNLCIRAFLSLLPVSVTHIHNFPEFNLANWACLLLTPLFYVAGHQLARQYSWRKNAISYALFYVIIFCIYLSLCGMFFNFVATSDPSSSIIIYLIALIAVAGVYTFEYQESLLLTIVNWLFFSLLLLYVHADPTQIIYNELLLLCLLLIFFFISRHIYSYRADQYMQLQIIKEKNEEIERASLFKNDVLGMVAHDLRNPIGAVESIAMLMEMDELDEDTKENVSMIKTSCRKAFAIINDLLEVARNDNSSHMEFVLVNLKDLLQDVVRIWQRPGAVDNPIILHAPTYPVYAEVNQEKFQRVMDNLISNAAKFSKENSPIEITLSEKDNHVTIEIMDHGVGIPPDLLPQLFDRFTRSGRQGLKGERSTGLGLSISRQIVEQHHGRIEVSSVVNKGTTFTIKLHQVKNG
ncbi:HAMP domain-containing histidine kinase [Mucilaginibacter daejeonensis]|uniref:sensor histidine kinase n=1 Tax=Mucilaginibacter daejeonensis TaxID=398049 RepID=UPI001D171AA9|nr:HAMP domain-containing sensor histidine kinase [Mucilaginibacter daejeonensis]UEG52744.1 HAMP domain-containing histidine kinase [Mucilaginibacter daejeonensis]